MMKDVSVTEVESSCEMGFTGYDTIYLSCLSCCDSSSTIKSICEMGRGKTPTKLFLRKKALYVMVSCIKAGQKEQIHPGSLLGQAVCEVPLKTSRWIAALSSGVDFGKGL